VANIIPAWPGRWLVPVFLVWILISTAVWPLMIYHELLDATRLGLAIFFLGGSVFSVIGWLRYMDWGQTVPALLVISLGKSLAFTFVGLGFLFLAFFGQPSQVDDGLVLVYTLFGAAAATKVFQGFYLFYGARRGWILREAYLLPWYATRAGKDK
jgi:hypothetical protein